MATYCLFLFVALLILYAFTFVPNHAESVKEMKRFAQTPRGFAALMGGTLLLTWLLNFVFVELWGRREARRRNKASQRQSGTKE
jgi:prepilin signal peptidase PulO-like enzyme (type II secretory pathway)